MSRSQSPLLRHRPQASAPPLSTPGLMRWGSERSPQAFVHVVLEPSLFPRANPDPYPGVTATATPGVVLSNSTTDAAFLQGSSCRHGSRFALRAMHGAVGVLPAAVGDADEHANQSAAVAALDDLPVAATHAHPLTACLRSVLVPLGLLWHWSGAAGGAAQPPGPALARVACRTCAAAHERRDTARLLGTPSAASVGRRVAVVGHATVRSPHGPLVTLQP